MTSQAPAPVSLRVSEVLIYAPSSRTPLTRYPSPSECQVLGYEIGEPIEVIGLATEDPRRDVVARLWCESPATQRRYRCRLDIRLPRLVRGDRPVCGMDGAQLPAVEALP